MATPQDSPDHFTHTKRIMEADMDVAIGLAGSAYPLEEFGVCLIYSRLVSRASLTSRRVLGSIKLKLNEEAISSAAVFYHTFYSSMTKENYDPNLVVMAALNLAAKVQEVPAKLSDVVNTCHRCLHQDSPPLEVGELYWQLKDSVARYELLLLRTLKFRLNMELPHKYLLHYLLALTRWTDEEAWQKSHVTTVAWALLQDSFHTTLCLHHRPTVVATAVFYLALHCCKLEVPGSRAANRPWWEVFSPGTSEKELQSIAEKIMQVNEFKLASVKQR